MSTTFEKEMRHRVEFIPGKLYFVALSANPLASKVPNSHFFSIDNEMVYWNFYLDFGPLNLGHTYRFMQILNKKLRDPKLNDKVIYFFSSTHAHKRTNAAFLICAWALLYDNKTPEESFLPFKNYPLPFPTWHDATPTVCNYQLTILHTLQGLYKARENRFFDFSNFDIEEYEHYEQVENGDLNWYCDNKFVAFAGPQAERTASPGGYYTMRPDDYVPYFKKKGVQLVVRLNKAYYDARKFTDNGIEHMDLYYLDGSNPSDAILNKFLVRAEATKGGIAVHCKAGLGRTGTVIGCYIMKHFKWTAEEIIGWMRIVRPGSIIGPQQKYMRDVQHRMWREGDLFRERIRDKEAFKRAGGGGGATSADDQSFAKEDEQMASNMSSLTISSSKLNSKKDPKQTESLDKQTQGDLLRIRRQSHAIGGQAGAASHTAVADSNISSSIPKTGGSTALGNFLSKFGSK
jgi:cell division cycle 14